MATENNGDHVRNTLALFGLLIPENILGHSIKFFSNINGLNEYVRGHIEDTDTFHIHIPGVHLEEFIRSDVHNIERVRRIYIYYDTKEALQSDQNRFASGSKETDIFKFCLGCVLEGQIENAETGGAGDLSRQIDRLIVYNVATSNIKRLRAEQTNGSDRHCPEPKRFASTVKKGFFIQNIGPPFICRACKTFFQEPYQLNCGHRLCKSCLNTQNSCAICSEFIAKDKAYFDQDLQNKKQQLLTTCLECKWEGQFVLYQGHVNQNHREDSTSKEQVVQTSLHEQILPVLANNSNLNNNHIQGEVSTAVNVSIGGTTGGDISTMIYHSDDSNDAQSE